MLSRDITRCSSEVMVHLGIDRLVAKERPVSDDGFNVLVSRVFTVGAGEPDAQEKAALVVVYSEALWMVVRGDKESSTVTI